LKISKLIFRRSGYIIRKSHTFCSYSKISHLINTTAYQPYLGAEGRKSFRRFKNDQHFIGSKGHRLTTIRGFNFADFKQQNNTKK